MLDLATIQKKKKKKTNKISVQTNNCCHYMRVTDKIIREKYFEKENRKHILHPF